METYFQAAESAYDAHFADQWDSVFKALATSHSTDPMWLAGSSSYVFSIDGIKFAVDLQIRRKKDLEILSPRLQNDLAPLSFVLITHPHDDHLNPAFIRTVKDLPIRWFLPAGIEDKLIDLYRVVNEVYRMDYAPAESVSGKLAVLTPAQVLASIFGSNVIVTKESV